jgi:hypothetical protein
MRAGIHLNGRPISQLTQSTGGMELMLVDVDLEVKYFGIIAKSDTNTSVTCTPKILIGSTSTDLSPVTYSNTVTPTIT